MFKPSQSPPLPTIAETLRHPAFPTATWRLEPDRKGLLPVAEGRGGPLRISWEIHGQGPVRILLLMGLGSLKTAWQRQTVYFGHERRDQYSVLVLDNRGVGDSDKPLMRYSTSEMARDVVEVLVHVGWLPSTAASGSKPGAHARSFHLVGLSMGGMIAQELACLVPHAIRSLSLCCTAAMIENTTTFSENMAERASMVFPKSVEASVMDTARQLFPAAWLTEPDNCRVPQVGVTPKVLPPGPGATSYGMFATNYQRFVAQEMQKRLDHRAFGIKGFLLQLVAAGWHWKSPSQLAVMADALGRDRILVMHGTVDGMISVPHGRKLVQYIEPGTALIIEGMGHAPIMERWEWFNDTLEKHVAKGEKIAGQA